MGKRKSLWSLVVTSFGGILRYVEIRDRFAKTLHEEAHILAEGDLHEPKRVEYSIALAAILLGFGIYFFDLIKYQNQVEVDPLSAYAVIIFSSVLIATASLLLFLITLHGVLLSKTSGTLITSLLEYLSSIVFYAIGLLLFFALCLFFCVIFFLLTSNGDMFLRTAGIVLILLFLALLAWSDGITVENFSPPSPSIKSVVLSLICLAIPFLLAFIYLLDTAVMWDFYSDKVVYDVNIDKEAIITFKMDTIITHPSSYIKPISNPLSFTIEHSSGEKYICLCYITSDKEFIGVVPIGDKPLGQYTSAYQYKLLKDHTIELTFLVCNSSKEFPCEQEDVLLATPRAGNSEIKVS